MKRAILLSVLFLIGTLAAPAQTFIQLWQVGIENNSQTDFAQENGIINFPPGSATAKDDDYYFAGIYPAPIGALAADEPANTNFERANLVVDTTNRIHFNLDASTIEPTTDLRLTIDVCCSDHREFQGTSGPIPFDIYFNDNFLSNETTSGVDGEEQIVTLNFTAGEVMAVTGAGGDNVVSIERVPGQGGAWMQFDYIRLEADADTLACSLPICSFQADRNVIAPGEQITLTWITAPGAAGRSIDNGVGSVEAQTTNGIGSMVLNPTQNTTYVLTSTLGGDTRTRNVTVQVAIIESFVASAFEVTPGTEVFLDWLVDPLASVSIDQGVGNVDADTIAGIGFTSVFPTELETIYTLTATRGGDVETATVTVLTNPFNQLWLLGVDDNSQAEFAQERDGPNPVPGNPFGVDDDYYFAGIFPAPIGALGSDEPVGNFERALLVVDPRVRIHFNLDAAQSDSTNQFRVRVNVCCSNHNDFNGFSGPIDFSVLFNGVSVLETSTNGVDGVDELLFTEVFTGAEVGAVVGENTVTIERKTDQGGSWMQFDQIILETKVASPETLRIPITDVAYDPTTGQFDITWVSEVGESYIVESSTDLMTWQPLETDYPTGGATGASTSYTGNFPQASNPVRFVRIRDPD
ncbi:MAG: hypothetical protein VCA38_12045 [Roseibacillus sp.]